ncbi:hypothetical protein LTR47_011370 [Exophiala xenobiotica]|nr:hypothetical protein LTR72_011544 [Exophiala xenobiotica]KAK5219834.1 hypothetical protein LTR47_011370 [Exophiala xenobiotica]KAK5243897.1 hypothetical protein LTS06_010429 [Exophiala xenobiotica]KAK5282084.1 hypothetical protein LTR40_003820 [Exophiala xenobiotica]KAK5284863.1 hypothetical protein LTR14_011434 [Exophiala xenobiotica]
MFPSSLQYEGPYHGSASFIESSGTSNLEMVGNSGQNTSSHEMGGGPVDDLDIRPAKSASLDNSILNDIAGDLTAFYNQLDGLDSFLGLVDFTPDTAGDQFALDSLMQPVSAVSGPRQGVLNVNEPAQNQRGLVSCMRHHDQGSTFSRFGSPLPSLHFAYRQLGEKVSNPVPQETVLHPFWRITRNEYQQLIEEVQGFSDIFPVQFHMLSRHSLSRYLEGCVKGLFEHLPFLHTATFSVAEAAPELVLAMAAIGAQFRFEHSQSLELFYVAKSMVLEQVQRRNKANIDELLSRPQYSVAYSSPSASARPSISHQLNEASRPLQENTTSTAPETAIRQRLQTTQALVALLVMGAWGPRQLVREAISLQSLIATLARDDVVVGRKREGIPDRIDWHVWALAESRKRTKLAVYCMLQLVSVAYNTPPLMFSSEIDCSLPASAVLWNAKTKHEWEEAYKTRDVEELSFRESLETLFRHNPAPAKSIPSPLANYISILALLQHIFLRRQEAATSMGAALSPDDVARIELALKQWQTRWERSPESNADPFSSAGPLAFNSTALLRLAWIRLYADLGPCRELASRDVDLIVSAFKNCPPLCRGPELIYPILQASYALATPIRSGLDYVAKTQTLTWSVQHSLSNFECAIFLGKWLELMAVTSASTTLEKEELILIQMIHSLLKETSLFHDEDFGDMANQQYQKQKTRRLAAGVARIWAEIFKGTHVFEVANVIGASLTIYAESMENEFRPSLSRP